MLQPAFSRADTRLFCAKFEVGFRAFGFILLPFIFLAFILNLIIHFK